MNDNSMTGTHKVEFPTDLVHLLQRGAKTQGADLRIEGWRGSWLTRVVERLFGAE